MPTKPLRKCNKPGCRELTSGRYCEKCDQVRQRMHDRQRGTAHERGYNSKWQRYSRRFLRENPLCACDECKRLPVPLPATITDHIVPHKGDKALFWDPKNHQPMAKRCHDRKTVRQDGGWGR